jgi:predicted CXXCH cytochrome family protein
MKRMVFICLALVMAATPLLAQPVGEIDVLGVPDRLSSANADQVTYGNRNVGVGERVVLQAIAIHVGSQPRYNEYVTVNTATWGFQSMPPGSGSTIQDTAAGSTDGLIVYFVPDSVGAYDVQMSATTDSGVTVPVVIRINAGTYHGAGIFNAATTSLDSFQCSPCHQLTDDKFGEWLNTGHAGVMPKRINDPAGHFADYCLGCHTVGMRGASGTNNNNFGELQAAAGWHVPHNGPNQYEDSLVATNPGLALLSGIQCESCHGPAAEHKANPGIKPEANLSSEMCGPCHFSSDRHPRGYAWNESAHAISMANGAEYQYMNRSGCSQCHTANGFIEQMIEGGTAGEYADPYPVTCAACHDPHSDKNPHQLRRASVAEACTGCHTTRLSSYSGLHHSHQGQMLIGADGTAFPGEPLDGVGDWTGWELPGYTYENSTHGAIEERCVTCHMANTPTYDPTFATPDTLLNRIGGHTFAVVWDNDTPTEPTDDILNYVGCEECHGQITLAPVRLTQQKTMDLLDDLNALLPQRSDSTPVHPQDPSLSTIQKAGSYNWYFVANDGSYGTHNFLYSKGLLESSIEQLELGAGADTIISITDVPNDQGKQVMILWTKFPAEMKSFDRAENYGVWRLDDAPTAAVEIPRVKNYREMLTSGPVGTQVALGEMVSTFVGTVPATGLDAYSFVAPTLFDSTASGMQWSFFVIAAYSAGNATVYLSPPDSGYSVDNLMPVTPTGLAAVEVTGGVQLTWNAPSDPDIDVFDVFRSTTASFDPTGMTPIASVKDVEYLDQDVANGTQYYWKIQAVDFSGNRSDYSDEVTLVVTDVETLEGLPTEFALKQNYPNPFNPTTEIGFAVPKATHIRLSVYTISGELVTTLVDDMMQAGRYRVTWDGQTINGTPVSSGLYLYRINAGDFVQTLKMVLLK